MTQIRRYHVETPEMLSFLYAYMPDWQEREGFAELRERSA